MHCIIELISPSDCCHVYKHLLEMSNQGVFLVISLVLLYVCSGWRETADQTSQKRFFSWIYILLRLHFMKWRLPQAMMYVQILFHVHCCHERVGYFPFLDELVANNGHLKMDFTSNVEWLSEFFCIIFCYLLTYPVFSHSVILSHVATVWPDVQRSSASILAF